MRFLYVISAIALTACSSNGGGAPSDAGADASVPDTSDDECLFCGAVEDVGTPRGDDGSATPDGDLTSCAQMQEALAGYQAAAQACNSNLTQQCNGATMGPCCPITVTSSNTSAVEDFDVAVASYVAACNPNCSMVICPTPAPPSHQCVGGTMGSGAVCE